MTKNGKRRRSDFEDGDAPTQLGVAGTLAMLRGNDAAIANPEKVDGDADGGDWQTVPSRKKSKKNGKDGGSHYPAITHSANARLQTHVRIGDLQSLVLYLLADGPAPQWVSVRHHLDIRKVVVLMVPGLERGMFDGKVSLNEPINVTKELAPNGGKTEKKDDASLSPDAYYPAILDQGQLHESLKPFADIFPHLWPIKAPGDDRVSRIHSPLAAILTAPLPKAQDEKKTKGPRPPRGSKDWQDQATPVTEYIATYDQLREAEFVPHPSIVPKEDQQFEADRRKGENQLAENGWVDTNASAEKQLTPEDTNKKDPGRANRPVYVIDCEMCMTGTIFVLTRISVLDWSGAVIYDTLVKPTEPITDYLTQYSGMTAEKLAPITTTLADVQAKLLTLLTPSSILIGHSLNSDLNALKLTHPHIIDTGLLYPHPRGPPLRSSLKWLAQKYLTREIQNGGKAGHDSIEDARAALDLVKVKCKKGPAWGTNEASSESIFKRIGRAKRHGHECKGAVVDWGVPSRGYGAQADFSIGCSSDAQVVEGVARAVNGDPDGREIPGGGVDFVWARLRKLEAVRGWWSQSRSADNEALLEKARAGGDDGDEEGTPLGAHVATTVADVKAVYASLPPCTALIVYTGTGDPRELSRLQGRQQQFKMEYQVKKWDQLSVKWTDDEEQALKAACKKARDGMGFVVVK